MVGFQTPLNDPKKATNKMAGIERQKSIKFFTYRWHNSIHSQFKHTHTHAHSVLGYPSAVLQYLKAGLRVKSSRLGY